MKMPEKLNTDILIVGAGLTGLTLAYYLKKAGKKVVVAERSDKPGGVIRTCTENGFTFETGPNTGILSTPEIVDLFEELAPGVVPETPGSASRSRWIWKKGKWHALPSGMASAVSTPLFTASDKLRILTEPFRKRGSDPDETVAGLVRRRLGASYLDYAVDPFISGIYAGDPDRLITRHALPKLYNLEQDHGSFIRGAFKKKLSQKDDREKKATREVFSVKGGLQKLTDAMAGRLNGDELLLNCRSVSVMPEEDGFTTNISLSSPEKSLSIRSSKVITTISSNNLSEVVNFLPSDYLKAITDLDYAKVVQVIAGYSNWDGIPVNAFGGLIPSREKRDALGILFPSSIFEGRAPEKGALLSVFLGGIKRPDMILKSDEELKSVTIKEINETLAPVNKYPDMLKVFRYHYAIPQYEKSTEDRLEAIGKAELEYPGLILAGNIRDGIGMADRVKQARTIAEQVIK